MAGFVKLKELFYAGSHGMDIIGPMVNLQQSKGHCIKLVRIEVIDRPVACLQLADSGEEDVLSFQAAAKFGPVMDRVYDDLVARSVAKTLLTLSLSSIHCRRLTVKTSAERNKYPGPQWNTTNSV